MTMRSKVVPAHETCDYISVHAITERRGGEIFRTRQVGFDHKSRRKDRDEVHGSISTTLTKNMTQVTLAPWLGKEAN